MKACPTSRRLRGRRGSGSDAVLAAPHGAQNAAQNLDRLRWAAGHDDIDRDHVQNAIVTKISQAEIRTTHMTGVVTDLGIELGRLVYWNRGDALNDPHFVKANRDKLMIHLTILTLFFVGGLAGALAFKRVGLSATVPLAALLMAPAALPLLIDLQSRRTLAN